jgi:glycosyltransferase involved in cell wall biosynthesis
VKPSSSTTDRQAGHQRLTVLIVAPYGDVAAGGQSKFATYLVDRLGQHVRIVHLAIPERNRRRTVPRALVTVWLLLRLVYAIFRYRVDVVHLFTPCHRSGLYEKLILATAARATGCKTILNFRNALDRWYCHWSPWQQRVCASLIGMNSIVLCQYRGLARYLTEQRIARPSQVRVLPNGLLPGEVTPIRLADRPSDGPVQIVFLGAVGYRKGVDQLIEAAALLAEQSSQPFVVAIAGPPDDRHELEDLQQRTRQLGADRYVHFVGPVAAQHKGWLLADADIFVLPSRAEGFPNSLLEAMAAGLPVVVSDRGAMPEIVAEGVGGLIVDAERPDRLAAALKDLIDSPQLRLTMGRYNRAIAEQDYDLRRVLLQFEALYEQVADQTDPPRRAA